MKAHPILSLLLLSLAWPAILSGTVKPATVVAPLPESPDLVPPPPQGVIPPQVSAGATVI